MNNPETQQRLAEIEEREKKATAGPWEMGLDYLSAGVNDGSNPYWVAPDNIPHGKCCWCASFRLVGEKQGKNSANYHVHANIANGNTIVSPSTLKMIFPDADESLDSEDAEFIAKAREDIPWLLQLVREQQKEIESHGPEGRNYTNLQYVTLLQENQLLQSEKQRLEREVERLKAALVPGGWASIGPLQLMECEDCHTEFMVLSCEDREEASCPCCLGDRIGFGESYAMIPHKLWPGSAAELYQQENERLRRALETIADASFNEDLPSVVYKTARKALAERSETP